MPSRPRPFALFLYPRADGGANLLARRRIVVTLGHLCPTTDHLTQRPEGDSLAVGWRAPGVPISALDEPVGVLRELPREAALADTGRAHDRDQPGTALASSGVEQVLQQPEVVVTADERRLQPARTVLAAYLGHNTHGTERADRRRLALEQLLTGRLVGDRLARGALVSLRQRARCRVARRTGGGWRC